MLSLHQKWCVRVSPRWCRTRHLVRINSTVALGISKTHTMASKNVLNVTNNCWLTPSMLAMAFENCSVGWTDDTRKQVRALTEPEAAEARKRQAQAREIEDSKRSPLGYSEVHGLKYQPSPQNQAAHRESRALMRAANWFAETALA